MKSIGQNLFQLLVMPKAKLLVIGLAPAANGGNRTGRIFTGDSSGDWLVKALFETGFANKPTSISKNDGLILKDVYLTAAVSVLLHKINQMHGRCGLIFSRQQE